MNSHYSGMYCLLAGDKVCVDGKQFTVFADMNEVGTIENIQILFDDKQLLSVDGVTFSDLSKCLSLMAGEQMRRTVEHFKKTGEVVR